MRETGAGVRVAVIDSGIHAAHPHISRVARAVHITAEGIDEDATDRLGHGTAVAAAILEKAPGIELVAIRVFDRALSTNARTLARAIEWAAADGCRLINLSLGTPNTEHAELLQHAVSQGGIVVAAAEWYPGCLPGVIGVALDWECPRDELRCADKGCRASGFPRPIPGIPPEKNLRGISFAVANTTGILARVLEAHPQITTAEQVLATLVRPAIDQHRLPEQQPDTPPR